MEAPRAVGQRYRFGESASKFWRFCSRHHAKNLDAPLLKAASGLFIHSRLENKKEDFIKIKHMTNAFNK